MYLTVHSSAALVIAKFIPNPLVAFIAGLASHFVLDAIPHGDEHLMREHFPTWRNLRRPVGAAVIDGIVMLFLLLIYVATTPLISYTTLGLTIAGAVLPDLLQAIYIVFKPSWLKWFYSFHLKIHNFTGHKIHWTQGLLVQGMVLAACWLIVM
ncbi:MAG: hypothetical protein HY973_00615 [Candidatus Kerfeldbacteria bacterium]|nr:hypothetical protein [Candidatus Kerfeldbacteria bacterium]